MREREVGWKQELMDKAAARGRIVLEDSAGVGIEFEDGCDVFWVLPGEPNSTIELAAEATVDGATLMRLWK